MSSYFTINTQILTKKNFDSEKVKDEEKRGHDHKQFEIIDNRDQEPKSTKKEETETKKPDEIQKPLWVKLNENDFDSLIQDVYNNLNNNEIKTTADKKTYDLKNAKKFLEKITTPKISAEDAKELYSDLIASDITKLKNIKGKGKNKIHKILEVLENLKSIFTGAYLHYNDVPLESEESSAERTKLKRKRSNEIANKEKMIDFKSYREYFECLSPSDMHKNLNNTIASEKNEAQVTVIKDNLANLMEEFKDSPTSNAKKIENKNNMVKIVEPILEFNRLNQSGQGFKILTPKQMLSRLPIPLAQLKAGNNSEKLKNEIRQLLYSLYRSKKRTKQIYKSLVDII